MNRIIGAIISMSSLWIGSYALGLGSILDWWHFPTFLTMLIFIIFGVFLVIFGDES